MNAEVVLRVLRDEDLYALGRDGRSNRPLARGVPGRGHAAVNSRPADARDSELTMEVELLRERTRWAEAEHPS